jgi:predicted MFS family arabinose efflux permease
MKPWQDGWYMRFLAVVVLFNTCFFLVFRLVPVFWKAEWGINERAIGLLLGLNGVIIVFLEMILVSRWEKRGLPMVYIVAGSLANAVGYAFLMLPGGAHLVYGLAMVLFITFGEMLALPFFNSIAMKRSNEYNRGQYAAAYTISWSVAIVIGPSGGAWIADTFGYRWLWATLIVISLFCAWAFSRFKLTDSNAQHEPGT